MPALYIDLASLRHLLWASATLSVSFDAWPTSAVCDVRIDMLWLPFVLPAMIVEAVLLTLHVTGVLRAPYLSIMPCAPFIQIPPVERVGVGVDGAFAICCVGALVLLGARLTCSPWPLIVAAAVVMLQALVLLIPRFGSPTFWRLHYYARVGSTGYEEWFCTADLAARAVITVPDSANAQVCVVGSGLSALPEVLRHYCQQITAVDASHAAITAMRERTPQVEWICADVADMRSVLDTGSIDLVCDKGTFAALLEHSSAACGAGFREAHRVLRPGGRLVTIALTPLSQARLAATGFDLEATYRLPAVRASSCDSSVYAQVARKIESVSGEPPGAAEDFFFDGAAYEEVAAAVELPLLSSVP